MLSNCPIRCPLGIGGKRRYRDLILSRSGVVAYFALGEATTIVSPFTAINEIGSSHGTYSNAANAITGVTLGQTGIVGAGTNTSALFASGHVEMPSITTLNGNPLTVSAWVYQVAGGDSFQRVVDRVYSGQFTCYINNNGQVGFAVAPTTGTMDVNNTCTITQSAWQHVVWTYDGGVSQGTANIWVQDAKTWTNSPAGLSGGLKTSTSNIRLGGRMDAGATRNFNGRIDEVVIYNRVLSDAEIAAEYTLGITA